MLVSSNNLVSKNLVASRQVNNLNYKPYESFEGVKPSFTKVDKYVTPISQKGEYFSIIRKSFLKSAKTAGRTFVEIARSADTSISDDLGSFLAISAVIGVIVGAFVFAFTLPDNLYNAHINYFTKSKEMDVFVRNNSAEKKIYERIDEKAKTANPEEKDDLAAFYMKMQIANKSMSQLAYYA